MGGLSCRAPKERVRHREFRNIYQLLCLTQAFSSAPGKKKMTIQEKRSLSVLECPNSCKINFSGYFPPCLFFIFSHVIYFFSIFLYFFL